jgi:phage major head subunit gpT-like protein
MLTLSEIKKMSESNAWTNSRNKTVLVNEAKEENTKRIEKNLWESKEIKYMRESFKRKQGIDFADKNAFPVHEDSFNWNKVAQKCGCPSVDVAFQEADSSSSFVQVLRAGVQTLVNSSYQTVPTTFESWTKTVNSTKREELYAPLHGLSFLSEVGSQELYPESRAAGLDIKLINRKYGVIYPIEKGLLEDDQTGQFAQQASLLGEYAKLALEAMTYAKLAGVFTGGAVANYSTLSIPNTETKPSTETNYPWSTSLVGGGANRPSSYTILTQAAVQASFIGLMNQKNLLGLKMSVDPNRLIIGPAFRFDAAVLLNSSFYPSNSVTGTAGTTGNSFAINPIESIAALTVTRFMFKNDATVDGTSKAWYLVDDKKPWFITQIRQAALIEQESPTAGESFNRDIIRFKLSLRANADHIDPRFAWQGNDGSVTS